ncbi:BEM_collapsed_G0048420.mRNA.1.CDS.1 [Saccharomyces cerevisiae]|nr:BEM_collapsed_G0048420.mRNA.1.CDS.1 [Saccharomyces cerevisiae]
MSCRRHRCIDRCCSGEGHRRTQDLLDESLVEAKHICLKPCNLTLSCGIHKCQRKCHPGKCPPCLESDSNDLVCPCGKTVVPAPVRCGTKLPTCNHPCIKVVRGESTCVINQCHIPVIPWMCHARHVRKPYLNLVNVGKKTKVRTVCFQTDVSCGIKCGIPLSYCYHTCQKKNVIY